MHRSNKKCKIISDTVLKNVQETMIIRRMETEDRIMGKQDARLIIFDMDGVILDSEPLHENARQMMFKK